jgi:hypothetical protein
VFVLNSVVYQEEELKIGKFNDVITYYERTTVRLITAENTVVTEMLGVWRTRG